VVRLGGALIGAAFLWAFGAGQALAAELSFEGEDMVRSSAHMTVVNDSAATNGRALKLLNNDRASSTFTTTARTARVLLRLRGEQCGDPPLPQVAVELDSTGNRIWTSPISARDDYVLYEGFVDIPAGTHTLYVHMTNDYKQAPRLFTPGCDRNLFVDTVALKDMPRLFAAGSYRNAALPDGAPVDPLSDVYRDALVANLDGARGTSPRTVNTREWSTPVYIVPAQQRRVPVAVQEGHEHSATTVSAVDTLEQQWLDVPLPPGAQPADPTQDDHDWNLVIYQPETDTLWEFFRFNYDDMSGKPQAVYGGRMTDVSSNPGYFTGPYDDPAGPGRRYGAAATSIPLLAGLQTLKELRAGAINHAVAFSVPNVREGVCRWPAQRTDTTQPFSGAALPEGIRFRLPADLDLSQFDLTPYGRMVARAVQRYGMVLTDGGTNFAFEAEDPTRFGGDPYAPIFGPGQIRGADGVLRGFPFDRLVALRDDSGQSCPWTGGG
jgi:hypothetical protein